MVCSDELWVDGRATAGSLADGLAAARLDPSRAGVQRGATSSTRKVTLVAPSRAPVRRVTGLPDSNSTISSVRPALVRTSLKVETVIFRLDSGFWFKAITLRTSGRSG